METYDHKAVEKKWQQRWEESQAFRAETDSKEKKEYLLIEFPYPSGDGLHVGHVRSWTALDVVARKRRMQGKNVLYPIGWDAFGLPTENYALKTGKDPRVVTKENTDNFRRQIKSLGLSFDWSREINTTNPAYYKWTQWIFLQFYKKGLAYKAKTTINWCPVDKIGLANEEVVDGCCERCGSPVEKREKEQWMLAITKYAQRLYDDLDTVNYITPAYTGQRNWIGPSKGAEIEFPIADSDAKIKVFTTRPDTLFGATYMVLAPEHPIVLESKNQIENWSEVESYISAAKNKSDIERSALDKEKTGVELKGVKAINPANKEEIPVYVADYVLGGYGTGAIMAVPAHDERDHAFAQKYDIPMREVVLQVAIDPKNPPVSGKKSVFRKIIVALLRNPKTGKYLVLRWKKQPWTTFVTGGIEEGETPEEAARREITEETGYKNIRPVRILGAPAHVEFYAAHKEENRVGHEWAALFELVDETQTPLSKEEAAIHDIDWVDESDIAGNNHANIDTILSRLGGGSDIYVGPGVLVNSGKFDGMDSQEAKEKITALVGGNMVTTFKLRDWVFSRQRYWGEPIPMIHCEKCGWQSVPEEDLPVLLPEVEKYQPTDTGESPLANIEEWVNVTCPNCKGPAKRETDVMPNWAGSSWYYLRYCDPKNDEAFADMSALRYWTPVDWYNGGMEHTTLHLLYSRFWHKFLFDIGLVPTSEPYMKRTSHGLILAEDGRKMSKSLGNVVNPDDIVERFGADSLRLYELFLGPFDQAVSWNTNGITGVRRFLERVWHMQEKVSDIALSDETSVLLNQTIQKVSDDIEQLKMNTAVSTLMILSNHLAEQETVPEVAYIVLLTLLTPFAPHMAYELAEQCNEELREWPNYDASKLVAATASVAVQVNGKVRATITLSPDAGREEALAAARGDNTVASWLAKGVEQKAVYVPGKVINFVVDTSI